MANFLFHKPVTLITTDQMYLVTWMGVAKPLVVIVFSADNKAFQTSIFGLTIFSEKNLRRFTINIGKCKGPIEWMLFTLFFFQQKIASISICFFRAIDTDKWVVPPIPFVHPERNWLSAPFWGLGGCTPSFRDWRVVSPLFGEEGGLVVDTSPVSFRVMHFSE